MKPEGDPWEALRWKLLRQYLEGRAARQEELWREYQVRSATPHSYDAAWRRSRSAPGAVIKRRWG